MPGYQHAICNSFYSMPYFSTKYSSAYVYICYAIQKLIIMHLKSLATFTCLLTYLLSYIIDRFKKSSQPEVEQEPIQLTSTWSTSSLSSTKQKIWCLRMTGGRRSWNFRHGKHSRRSSSVDLTSPPVMTLIVPTSLATSMLFVPLTELHTISDISTNLKLIMIVSNIYILK